MRHVSTVAEKADGFAVFREKLRVMASLAEHSFFRHIEPPSLDSLALDVAALTVPLVRDQRNLADARTGDRRLQPNHS